MKSAWLALAGLCVAAAAWAGPNAGGTIFVHDPSFAFTDPVSNYCGSGTPVLSCASADLELDGSSPYFYPSIWKCYAALLNAPRLKGISFGIRYPALATGISIVQWGPCIGDTNLGAAEYPGSGWPGSNTGDMIVFQNPQTVTTPIEFYWFAGYTKSAAAHNLFELRGHPDPSIGGYFFDDSVPSVPDSITGYGSLGFDTPGRVSCPTPPGACCLTDSTCVLTWQNNCTARGIWNGGSSCEPNPCGPSSGVQVEPASSMTPAASPNPAGSRVTISYRVPEASTVKVTILDAAGRTVRHLADAPQSAGNRSVIWDRRDDGGMPVPSGAYFYRVQIAGKTYSGRIIAVP